MLAALHVPSSSSTGNNAYYSTLSLLMLMSVLACSYLYSYDRFWGTGGGRGQSMLLSVIKKNLTGDLNFPLA